MDESQKYEEQLEAILDAKFHDLMKELEEKQLYKEVNLKNFHEWVSLKYEIELVCSKYGIDKSFIWSRCGMFNEMEKMWIKELVQEKIAQLKEDGYYPEGDKEALEGILKKIDNK